MIFLNLKAFRHIWLPMRGSQSNLVLEQMWMVHSILMLCDDELRISKCYDLHVSSCWLIMPQFMLLLMFSTRLLPSHHLHRSWMQNQWLGTKWFFVICLSMIHQILKTLSDQNFSEFLIVILSNKQCMEHVFLTVPSNC